MLQFFRDMSENPFLGTGLLAGVLASLACGMIGPYVITRRIVFLSGAIAHVALGGIGAAIFVSQRFPDRFGWVQPIHGATAAALLGAVIIAVAQQRVRERLDTLIGAMWAIGMSVGILLIKFTPGYHTDVMSYLFGSIALVGWPDVWLIAALNVVIIAVVALFHKRLLAICVDEQQARLQGINVLATNVVLLGLVALTVICLIQVVGLILVLALLTLPAATAAHYVSRLTSMMLVCSLLCMLLTTLPRIGVYGTKLNAESAIVLAAGGVYLTSILFMCLRARRQRPCGSR